MTERPNISPFRGPSRRKADRTIRTPRKRGSYFMLVGNGEFYLEETTAGNASGLCIGTMLAG